VKRQFETQETRWEENMKVYFSKIGFKGGRQVKEAQNCAQ
jgi:hypothetical protein